MEILASNKIMASDIESLPDTLNTHTHTHTHAHNAQTHTRTTHTHMYTHMHTYTHTHTVKSQTAREEVHQTQSRLPFDLLEGRKKRTASYHSYVHNQITWSSTTCTCNAEQRVELTVLPMTAHIFPLYSDCLSTGIWLM